MSASAKTFVANLSAAGSLLPLEEELVHAVLARQVQMAEAKRDVARYGEVPRNLKIILEGWAIRYRLTEDGRRQNLSFMIPGDVCDTNVFMLDRRDHSIAALTRLHYAELSHADLVQLQEYPNLARGLQKTAMVALAIQREWTTNLGQRNAFERVAHLFCEVFSRMEARGLTHVDSCQFPVTQFELAEASGLSPVHVNRTLMRLRREGLVDLVAKRLMMLDRPRLEKIALFDPCYLHLAPAGLADPLVA